MYGKPPVFKRTRSVAISYKVANEVESDVVIRPKGTRGKRVAAWSPNQNLVVSPRLKSRSHRMMACPGKCGRPPVDSWRMSCHVWGGTVWRPGHVVEGISRVADEAEENHDCRVRVTVSYQGETSVTTQT